MIFWLPWDVESVTLNRIGEKESRPANRAKISGESEAIHRGVVHDKTAFARRMRRFHAVSRAQRPRAGGGPGSRGPEREGAFGRGRRNGGRGGQREGSRRDRPDQRCPRQPG